MLTFDVPGSDTTINFSWGLGGISFSKTLTTSGDNAWYYYFDWLQIIGLLLAIFCLIALFRWLYNKFIMRRLDRPALRAETQHPASDGSDTDRIPGSPEMQRDGPTTLSSGRAGWSLIARRRLSLLLSFLAILVNAAIPPTLVLGAAYLEGWGYDPSWINIFAGIYFVTLQPWFIFRVLRAINGGPRYGKLPVAVVAPALSFWLTVFILLGPSVGNRMDMKVWGLYDHIRYDHMGNTLVQWANLVASRHTKESKGVPNREIKLSQADIPLAVRRLLPGQCTYLLKLTRSKLRLASLATRDSTRLSPSRLRRDKGPAPRWLKMNLPDYAYTLTIEDSDRVSIEIRSKNLLAYRWHDPTPGLKPYPGITVGYKVR
ncbi:MAG TPA: hypothetical protein VGK19_00005 [Capsulimonadaceae bacterium]|jgi:hypothetical protein